MLLKEFLEPLGVSQVEAAKRMNIPFQRLNAIVKGRRGVSARRCCSKPWHTGTQRFG
jgi:plasmid maintenance system antidote protein VapI